MEPIRLHGKERHEWERSVIARQTRSRQLVLRVLLDLAGGKAECWPSNARIGRSIGLKGRAVQLILRSLEASGAIRCVPDDRLYAQRRIVLLNHPGTSSALSANKSSRGGASASTRSSEKGARARAQTSSPKPSDSNPSNNPTAESRDDFPGLDKMSPALRHRFKDLLDGLDKDS